MLEVQMENCLVHGDPSGLVSVLHHEGLTGTTLTRLDRLVTKDLCGSSFTRVLVVLKSLEILSENRVDLQKLIDHGLTAKVVLWFEAIHDLLTSDLLRNSASLLSLAEEFYDYFQLLGQASLPVSQLSVVLLQLARFALEPEIHFPLRLEAIRTFNSILESLSREQKKLIQMDQNQTLILSQMAAAVLTVGDYELQVSLSEALCRLTPRKDRQQRANRWFSSCDISSAFCDVRDGDFEVDCRRFLNFVNGHHGDQRRVFTFPCVSAFLDSTELFPPKDDKLDEFWIDFNVSSGCVSFFIDEPEGFLWGSIHLLKENVDRYSLHLKDDECTGAETVLRVRLNNPIMHHNSRGQTVELNFNSEHHQELEEAAGKVFMDPGGTVQVPPSGKLPGRSYSRKNPQSKSQLKVLPLSSPSSEEDSSPFKMPASRSEFLFDRIRHSTPTRDSGVPVGAELESLKEVQWRCDGKRAAPDSGYLSDQDQGPLPQKRRAEAQTEGEETLPAESSNEGAGPPEEEEGLFDAGAPVEGEEPLIELQVESDLTSGITAAFNNFKTQLDKHFTVSAVKKM
ncbi:synaptonemal complex protein 2-like [Cyclopterus lumpus]|uniref:synaptonemal complex protein 2-like n=1 Tax=Cyclopterus lumpus TaxID=8103 RepID=UPI001486B23F|nr:synaptonemal complex protein 2-like [Cyclopterus lumpus]